MESVTIFVTGASGFVGSGVVPHLLSHGYSVRALVREGSGRSLPDHPHLTRVIADVRDPESLEAAMNGIDWVVHLAAAIADEAESEAVNVGGARNLAEACRKCRVKVLINVSTQSARLKRKGLYGRTKDEADRILHAAGIPVVTLRASVIYGNLHSGVFGSLLQFTRLPVVPIIGSGEAVFRPIHRDDLAEIITRCARNPAIISRTFDVGGPDAISFLGLVDEMLRRQNGKKPKLHIPQPIAMALAVLCSFLPHPPITRSNVLGAAPCTRSGAGADEQLTMHPEELWQQIGFVPRTLSSGLDALFAGRREWGREEEARALLCYVMSGGGGHWFPACKHVRRFLQATEKLEMRDTLARRSLGENGLARRSLGENGLARRSLGGGGHCIDPILRRHPLLLGALDAITRLRFPDCILQKKMLIAAAIVECSPESAGWLLPRERSIVRLVLQIFGIALVALVRLCIGIPLLAFPLFLERNAGR